MIAFFRALIAYFAGKSSQRTADQAAATKETVDALQSRAKTDDTVAALSDSAARDELRSWSAGSKT